MVEQAIRIGLEEKVDVGRSIIYGLQHMVAMFAGVVAAPLIVGAAIGLEPLEKTVLIQGALLACGMGTILQSMRIGFVGAKLPICMGTAFVFITPMISIGKSMGIATIFGEHKNAPMNLQKPSPFHPSPRSCPVRVPRM